jgi:replication-associated recombination protein RarA
MGRYDIKTINGYDFFECSSALQKSIRRGMEDEAMFWAVELFNSNFAEYVWKRLRIMSSEDIGLAEENISSEINALYQMHKEQAKKKDDKNKPERLFLTHAVLLLSRSVKSRTIDWALMYYWGCHQNRLRPIPDIAYDKHNDKGRKMGRSWKHFFEEGTILIVPDDYPTEEEYKALAEAGITGTCGQGLFD